jgi:hypothetical protein
LVLALKSKSAGKFAVFVQIFLQIFLRILSLVIKPTNFVHSGTYLQKKKTLGLKLKIREHTEPKHHLTHVFIMLLLIINACIVHFILESIIERIDHELRSKEEDIAVKKKMILEKKEINTLQQNIVYKIDLDKVSSLFIRFLSSSVSNLLFNCPKFLFF